ncbi:hypothetical protein CEXT_715211 [Caerostris extrusa]|uniref:Uncharacterized protein n=1 Tax=Caerostris extrusa TaxID=172846 RepID=A0AAV4WX99_CAEEX|nr:hypothetical protein CEXT_715211 [Caerostris extrusa]
MAVAYIDVCLPQALLLYSGTLIHPNGACSISLLDVHVLQESHRVKSNYRTPVSLIANSSIRILRPQRGLVGNALTSHLREFNSKIGKRASLKVLCTSWKLLKLVDILLGSLKREEGGN